MFKNSILYFIGLFIVAFLCINASCKAQKSKQIEKIVVGSGGGFTGVTKEYIINKDGTVSLKEGEKKDATGFGKISQKHLHDLAKKLEEESFQTIDLNEPGNFYYYIEVIQKDKNHRVTWSGPNNGNVKKMQELYAYLMDIILKSKINK